MPEADAVNDAAVAAYRLSVQAGNPLPERRIAQMFGRTSRRWARARIADARQTPPRPDSPGTGSRLNRTPLRHLGQRTRSIIRQAFLARVRTWFDARTDQVIIMGSLILGSRLIGYSTYLVIT